MLMSPPTSVTNLALRVGGSLIEGVAEINCFPGTGMGHECMAGPTVSIVIPWHRLHHHVASRVQTIVLIICLIRLEKEKLFVVRSL